MSLKILVVEDDLELQEALMDTLMMAGYQTCAASDAETAKVLLQENDIQLVVSDIQLGTTNGISLLKHIRESSPALPVILMTAYGTIQQAVEAIQLGARDYLVKPFEPEVLISQVARFDEVEMRDDDGFIAVDANSREVVQLAKKVAANNVTVLITGESGTGKEVLVQYIHKQSERSNKPFIAINCAAIPENMLEAMLFGYQKGAFTGAYKSSPGKFELAQGGTLLLDEISEMSLALQAKLLRVLQEKEVERLGDQKLIELDVRVMATSNRNMHDEVKAGRFREDLFYRLNVFPIAIRPLRDRADDIIPVAKHIVSSYSGNTDTIVPELDASAERKLLSHNWPGNVRELDNVMQRAIILQSGNRITAEDIIFEVNGNLSGVATDSSNQLSSVDFCDDTMIGDANNDQLNDEESLGSDLKQHEQKIIIDALNETSGSRKSAAEKLGISPRTLRYKLAKMRDAGVQIPAR